MNPNTPKDAPAFDFYPERWIAGTRHMTKTERSDYLELLCIQWLEDGLPDDLDRMARIVGHKHAGQMSPQVMEKFPSFEDGKRRNRRLETEREKQRERIAKRRHGAAKTNTKRWRSESLSDRSATPERPESDIDSESPPPTTHHPPHSNETNTPRVRATAPGYPDSEEQARSMAEAAGVPADYAATLWHECEGGGGHDFNGNAVSNFPSWIKACWNRRQENDLRRRPPEKPRGNSANNSTTSSSKTPESAKTIVMKML